MLIFLEFLIIEEKLSNKMEKVDQIITINIENIKIIINQIIHFKLYLI